MWNRKCEELMPRTASERNNKHRPIYVYDSKCEELMPITFFYFYFFYFFTCYTNQCIHLKYQGG